MGDTKCIVFKPRMTFYIEDWETFKPLVPDGSDVMMMSWWRMSLRWPMMSELSGRLWPTDSDTLMVRWLAPNWAGPASHSAEAGAGVFREPAPPGRVTVRGQAGAERERGIDKSKTLITTGYSASPVNMGLIWAGPRPPLWAALYWYYRVATDKDMYKVRTFSICRKKCLTAFILGNYF